MGFRVRVSMAFTSIAILVLSALGLVAPTAATAAMAGDVLAAQRVTVYLVPGQLLKVPVNAWKILYHSTSATGTANQVSGLLLVPKAGYSGTRPIIGYAIGTHGLGDQCAPSNQMQAGTDPELALVSLLLARGWAVAVTDYEGLGTPGDHTYMAGVSQGRAVLDSIRAAARVPGSGLSAGAPVGIVGYSQGGSSAAWAAQLQPAYAPDLKLRGVAAGGVPADLRQVAENVDGTDNFGLAAAAGIGLDAAYPELRLDDYLTPEATELFDDVRDDCLSAINEKTAGRRLADLTTANVLALPAWQARLAETRIGGIAPRAPIYLFHAKGDEIIPASVGDTLRREWCAQGARVLWTKLPAPSHVLGAVGGTPLAVQWLAHRFAGLPTLSNCP
ncbi:lipase [Microtetraspora sp. NBRC 13810]|uniref:lipase family protein n=1 Tax=Microtetraspora sp. NBRC 13810 TaxID=3030990 RepID=UPI0024A1250B|nr:lipase family protein [Microtetraspora sp. NBRC 13810]GLW09557.1 lipase [Microtetraspora sp. NBRC 13810]